VALAPTWARASDPNSARCRFGHQDAKTDPVIRKQGGDLVTSRMLGFFRNNPMTRQEFLVMTQSGPERGQ
jgi:hypothetical protein